MNGSHIVVGGSAYADIDVLACVVAYTELLLHNGHEAKGIITGPWNQTIPNSIRKWPIPIENSFQETLNPCHFILVDISDPKFMEKFVRIDQVSEIYDHHYGHESFWKEKLPNDTHIERVGACATLIWEKFKENNCEHLISEVSANLLYTAIFSNTLNFKSLVTVDRDRIASEEILKYASLPQDWKSIYYSEVAEGFNKDLSTLIQKDTKLVDFHGSQIYFGQVEIWNATPIIHKFEHKFTPKPNEEWLINIASIEEDHSYFYTNSARLQEKMAHITDATRISENFQVSSRLWLRKEILRKITSSK